MNILGLFTTNPTQITGLLSFAATTIACLLAAQRLGATDTRIWRWLAFANFLFFLDIVTTSRRRVHDFADSILKGTDWYAYRRAIQITGVTTAATIAVILVIIFLVRSRHAGGSVRVAATVTFALLAFFGTEAASPSVVDAILYRPIGPVLFVGWIWAIAAVGICLAARRR